MTKPHALNVRLPDGLYRLVKSTADYNGQSLNSAIILALRAWVEAEGKRQSDELMREAGLMEGQDLKAAIREALTDALTEDPEFLARLAYVTVRRKDEPDEGAKSA